MRQLELERFHYSLPAVTHAPFHASVLRPASQVDGPNAQGRRDEGS